MIIVPWGPDQLHLELVEDMANGNGITGSQPLKWHGGKFYLARQIISMFPEHVHYVEPFFGGGAVFFSKPSQFVEGHSELVNDINLELMNFWTVLKVDELFRRFTRAVEATPFSKVTWEESVKTSSSDPVARAVAFFVRYRQSRQGLGTDFATMSRSRTRRGMNEQVSSWLSAVEGLPEAHERLKRVVICNENAASLIKREDSKDTFFYLDPPYLHETRTAKDAYEFEMSPDQHEQLLEVIASISGKFLLSGYPSAMYDRFSRAHRWNRVDVEIDNKASGLKNKPIKTECFWTNY